MSESWLQAAEAYAARSNKFRLKPEQIRLWLKFTKAIVQFYRSEEGFAAMALLATTDNFIVLLVSEGAESEDEVIGITAQMGPKGVVAGKIDRGRNTKASFGWGKMGPSKIMQDPLGLGIPFPPVPVYPQDFAMALLQAGKTEEEVLQYLREELDKLAQKAPKPVEM